MSEFKVGDKVEVIGNKRGGFEKGTKGTVTHDGKSSLPYEIQDSKGEVYWHTASELKLIESKSSKNQRITALEETVVLQEQKIADLRNDYRYEVEQQQKEINDLKVIVHQLRENGLPSIVAEGPTNIIEFEGAQYKKVDRLVREGDLVILNERGTEFFFTNKPYVVKNNRIHDEQTSTNGAIYDHGRKPETVDVYELIVEDKQPAQHQIVPCVAAKSPNELRAEIIEKAKVFVESQFKEHWNDSGDSVISVSAILHTVEFVVNEEKRQVSALLRSYGKRGQGMVDYNGKAKCNPSDVFNEHIGRAIALGRALGLDVSEFEKAVQPNEVVKGHVVETFSSSGIHHETFEVGSVTRKRKIELRHVGETQNLSFTPYEIEYGDCIINDTNAQYGGVE